MLMDNNNPPNSKKEANNTGIRKKQYSLNKKQNSFNSKSKEKIISKRSNTNLPNKSNSNKTNNNNNENFNNNLNNNNICKKSNSNNISRSNNNNLNNLNNPNNNLNINKPSSGSKSNVNIISNISKKKEENIRIEFGDLNPKLDENKKFNNNKIVSTKYNVITWAPKSLLIQFRRAANIYFLLVTILTSLNFSPKQPGSMIATFCLVLIATMLKEGFEDYYRYKQDRQANNRLVSKLVKGQWVEVLCWTLRPGDVVKVKKEEEFSADILIIKSTNDTGYCYIDTKNLDGETNLKEKCSLEDFKKIPEENIGKLLFHIEVEKPNENLTSWKGLIEYEDREGPFCSLANLILKGSVLKNTKYIIGIIVYSGKDTKIMKNSKAPRMKMSKVLVTMNKLLYSVFAFEIGLCLTFAILSTNWTNKYISTYKYIFASSEPNLNNENIYIVDVFINFLTFFVAYSHMIPISLYVALEIVKIIQGLLIKYDNEIYDFGIDKPATCRSTDLIEELGQVEFIFSDKTGTLTQNSMILKKVYINGKVYGSMQDEHPETPNSINGDMSIFRKLKAEAENLNLDTGKDLNLNLKAPSESPANNSNDKNNLENKISVVSKESNRNVNFVDNAIAGKNRNEINIAKMPQNDLNNANYNLNDDVQKNTKLDTNINNNNLLNYNDYNSNNKLITIPDEQQGGEKADITNNNNNNNNNNINNKENEVSKISSSNTNNPNQNKTNNNNLNDNNNLNIPIKTNTINTNTNNNNNKNENLNYKIKQIPPTQTTLTDTEHDKKIIIDFFHLLTLCHACFPERNKENKIIYQGASPDDIALVKGAQQMGFEYSEKEFSEMTIKNYIHNTEKKYDLKVEFPFDSDRKRMSVIVQEKQTKGFSLLGKGADTTMLSRMKLDSAELDEINRVIKVLSKEGLRVLVIGSKQLTSKEYNSWFKNYSEDRNNGKDLNKLYEKMECNLNFMGLTAIEDKLQDGVPDTIYTLLTCNIRVWVLTGDKQDTAEEIAKSCKLINENMSIIYLLHDPNGKSPKEKIRELIMKYGLKPESSAYDGAGGKKAALVRNSGFSKSESKNANFNSGADAASAAKNSNIVNSNNNNNNNYSNIKNNAGANSNIKDNKNENENAINKINSKLKNTPSKISNINNNDLNYNPLSEANEDIKSKSSWESGAAEDENHSEEIIDLEYITKKIRKKEGKDISLIIDGITLEEILQDKNLSYLFFKISIAAKSVVCCRVSPKQKSKVVQLVKKYGKWVTLSIGDGANDVPMIMEAHIGVGIQGKEGTQAVRSADFSIGQFRFLEKLLLIYGRIGYMKISKFICYYFYKNIILVFTDIFFAFSNGFSGQIYFADYLSTLYNALFTSWPCVLTFSFEKDLDLSIIKKFPILYVAGQKNYFFNLKIFWSYILYAIFHAFICFFIPNLGLLNANDKSGITLNHWYKSTTSFSLVIQIVTLKLMVISDFWNGLNIFSTFASIVLYYVILIVFCFKPVSVIFQNELAGLIFNLFSYPKFWLVILITPLLALVPDITLKQIFYSVYPTPTEYIKQYLKDQVFLNMVFNDENQTFILNSQQAKDAEKRLQEILKRSRAQKLKRKLVDKNGFENSEFPLKDGSYFNNNNINNNLLSNDRSRRVLLDNPQQIRIKKRKSKYTKQQELANNQANVRSSKIYIKNNKNNFNYGGLDSELISGNAASGNVDANFNKNKNRKISNALYIDEIGNVDQIRNNAEFNSDLANIDIINNNRDLAGGAEAVEALNFKMKRKPRRNSNLDAIANYNNDNNNIEADDQNENHNFIEYENDMVNEKTEEHNYMEDSNSDVNQKENFEEGEEEEEEYEYEENKDISGEQYDEDFSHSNNNDNKSNENQNESGSRKFNSDSQRNKESEFNNNTINTIRVRSIDNARSNSTDRKDMDFNSVNNNNLNVDFSARSKDIRRNSKFNNSARSSVEAPQDEIGNSNTPSRKSKNLNNNNNFDNEKEKEHENKIFTDEDREAEEIKNTIKNQTTKILEKIKNKLERKNTKRIQKKLQAEEENEMSFNSSECSDSSDSGSFMGEIKEEKFEHENENDESSKNKSIQSKSNNNSKNNSLYVSRGKSNKNNTSSKNEAPLFHEESKNEIFEIQEVRGERSHRRKSAVNNEDGFLNAQGDFINLNDIRESKIENKNNFENLLCVRNDKEDRSFNSSNHNSSGNHSLQRSHYDQILNKDAKVKKLKHK